MGRAGLVKVAVVTSRPDIDLAISLWLPGYQAVSVADPDSLIELVQGGGVGLLDLPPGGAERWLPALRSRGFDGPLVLVAAGEDTVIDVERRVVVAPLQLPDLADALELALSKEPWPDLAPASVYPSPPPPPPHRASPRPPSTNEAAAIFASSWQTAAEDNSTGESLFDRHPDHELPAPSRERARRQASGGSRRRQGRLRRLF